MIRTIFKYNNIDIDVTGHEDDLAKAILRDQTFYEIEILERLVPYLKQSDEVIDVGANIGNHTLFFSKVLGCAVSAFEPCEENFRILMRNCLNNGILNQVALFQDAVWNNNTDMFIVLSNPDNMGMTRVRRAEHLAEFNNPNLVRAITIDKYARGPVHLIKIDVEGCEPEVIEGARETIINHRPYLLVELNDSFDATKFCDDFGYRVEFIDRKYNTALFAHKEKSLEAVKEESLEVNETVGDTTEGEPRKATRGRKPSAKRAA